ncbi:MAG: hypothetical protein ACJ79H_20190 [Myxococcales bacterium]
MPLTVGRQGRTVNASGPRVVAKGRRPAARLLYVQEGALVELDRSTEWKLAAPEVV